MAFFVLMKDIKISEYNYELPNNRIAKYPLKERDKSKSLLYKNGTISEEKFSNIHSFLPENSLLLMNNTKVIFSRLNFKKITGAKIEVFCLNPHTPSEYNMAFEAKKSCEWQCIVGNLKKWKKDNIFLEYNYNETIYTLKAQKRGRFEDKQIIEFSWDTNLTFGEILSLVGQIPIPPYLNRKSEDTDKNRYQTVYSKYEGSVAAPTAGLHFTNKIFNELKNKKIELEEVTLHVGAGTFKPVKTENVSEHDMHNEFFVVKKSTIEKIIENLGAIISVGTTTLRTLESIYWIGVKLYHQMEDFSTINQWENYKLEGIDIKLSLDTIVNYLEQNDKEEIEANTQIIIVPGYEFKIVDILITNFHQPQSTLLLLVAALIGKDWKKVYDFALKNEFRFLSYGDSSLLFKKS